MFIFHSGKFGRRDARIPCVSHIFKRRLSLGFVIDRLDGWRNNRRLQAKQPTQIANYDASKRRQIVRENDCRKTIVKAAGNIVDLQASMRIFEGCKDTKSLRTQSHIYYRLREANAERVAVHKVHIPARDHHGAANTARQTEGENCRTQIDENISDLAQLKTFAEQRACGLLPLDELRNLMKLLQIWPLHYCLANECRPPPHDNAVKSAAAADCVYVKLDH